MSELCEKRLQLYHTPGKGIQMLSHTTTDFAARKYQNMLQADKLYVEKVIT